MRRMKFWISTFLGLGLVLAGCARVGRLAPGLIKPVTNPQGAADQVVAAVTPAPELDLSSMTFVEKNDLYLQLLAERGVRGEDTSSAEEAYARFLEASLEGDEEQADQFLEQALLALWAP